MADQSAENVLMPENFLDGNGDFLADNGIFSFVSTVLGAIGNGQGIHAGFFDKVIGSQGVGISGGGAEHMILYTCQYTQLALYRNASFVGQLDHFPVRATLSS